MPFTHEETKTNAPAPAAVDLNPRTAAKGESYDAGAAALSPRAKEEKAAAQQEKERQAAAQAKYKSLLGSWLGEKLYSTVHKELSPEKLLGHGQKGLDGALKALVGLVDPVEGFSAMDEKSEAQAVAKFAEALGGWAKSEAEEWLKGEDGQKFFTKANHWAEGHPGWIVAAAMAAAAGAVAANVDIPEIKQKFKLGDGLTASLGVNLNKIRDIAFKGASASLAYSRNGWEASAGYEYTAGDVDTHKVNAKVGHDGKELTAAATMQGDKLVVDAGAGWKGDKHHLKVGAKHTSDGGQDQTLGTVSLRLGDKDHNVTTSSSYNFETGALTVDSTTFAKLSDQYSLRTSVGSNEKGDYASMGLDYSPDKAFKLSLDYKLSEVQGQSLSVKGSRSWKNGDNQYRLHGAGQFNLDEGRVEQANVGFKWQDKAEFKGIALDLKHKYGDVPETTFNAIADATAGEVMFRVQNRLSLSDLSVSGNVTQAHAAYQLNDNWTVFGGGKYGYQADGHNNLNGNDRGAWAEAGVQYKKVPLKIGYRPEDGAVSFGITIPFGR